MMNRRLRLSTLSFGAVFLGQVLVGCGSGQTESANNSDSGASPSQTGSAEQIVLTIGGESEDGYDPTLGWGRYGSPLFQSTLLRRDDNLDIVN
ncbi:MAG: ABC transporter substrate-binding protein, partial [Leptolyngbyaceae cyanobacterium SL_1_1]|nr:ABC transporter substrate-binding protein [Leptolyngbyaceae cyanobacterium SL_1_1]